MGYGLSTTVNGAKVYAAAQRAIAAPPGARKSRNREDSAQTITVPAEKNSARITRTSHPKIAICLSS